MKISIESLLRIAFCLCLGLLPGCSKSKEAKSDVAVPAACDGEKSLENSARDSKPQFERLQDVEAAIEALGFEKVFVFRFQGMRLEGWVQVQKEDGPVKVHLVGLDGQFAEREPGYTGEPSDVSGAIVIALRKREGDTSNRDCVVKYHVNVATAKQADNKITTRTQTSRAQTYGDTYNVPVVRFETSPPFNSPSSRNREPFPPWTELSPASHSFQWTEGGEEEDWELFRITPKPKTNTP